MSKMSKAATTASVVAQGPAGARRLAAGCLVVVLLGALMIAGLVAFGAWTAKNSHDAARLPLPCPPQTVAVAYSTKDAPNAAREAVTEAIRASGRTPIPGGWGDKDRDLVVVWSPGSDLRVSSGSNPVRLTLGAVPTAAEVREALGARLAACGATPTPSDTAAPSAPQETAQGAPKGFSWPWERGLSTTGALGVLIGLWWLAGPSLVRGAWRVLAGEVGLAALAAVGLEARPPARRAARRVAGTGEPWPAMARGPGGHA